MPSPAHKKLVERIKKLDAIPDDATEFAEWIKADRFLALLRNNAEEDELIVYRFNAHNRTFINTVVVSENDLIPLDQNDLLHWFSHDLSSSARYAWGSGEGSICIERGNSWHVKSLRDARQLVFTRHFTSLEQTDAFYFEILQEYAHLAEIHWRRELHGYCRFDEYGDYDHIVSVTSQEDRGRNSLITFKREPLEEYLAASNSVLVRMFNFELMRRGKDFESPRWPTGHGDVIRESESLFYTRKVAKGKAAKTCGVQIIHPSRTKSEIFAAMERGWSGTSGEPYVEFTAWDWRNKRITKISTDPDATTNYPVADENSLPFETSPAFFRPEALLRYKGDKDKYTIGEDTIGCRGAWSLRIGYIEEASLVYTHIGNLRDIPYQEQQYWLSFNEVPKAEFCVEGEVIFAPSDPLQKILYILNEWHYSTVTWWKLREETLLERVTTPRTTSRDEWAGAFSDLAKLVDEGFQGKAIKARLREMDIAFGKDEKSLTLIEKFLIGCCELGDGERLSGLREVEAIRSKVYAHSGGRDANSLANRALQEYDSYSAHFESVCETVAQELKLIEYALS